MLCEVENFAVKGTPLPLLKQVGACELGVGVGCLSFVYLGADCVVSGDCLSLSPALRRPERVGRRD